jgi:LysM repeat protein
MSGNGASGRYIYNLLLFLVVVACLLGSAFGEAPANVTGQQPREGPFVTLDEFSPSFLGMYRKVMQIERNIAQYSLKYQVDFSLALAVCMFESGGNAHLRSPAGAQGYFQVMPSTFRSMRVRTNIEAGVKYLGQLLQRFDREDYVLAAYNGGPTRVARGRVMPLETQQYVIGVRNYKAVLKKYEPLIRGGAHQLRIETVRPGEDWWRLSRRLNLPLVQLRLYNPFLAARTLKPGYQVVYPLEPKPGLLAVDDDNTLSYRARLGDNLINLAFALGVDPDALRQANGLEPLESLPPGTMLEIPLGASATFTTYRVTAHDNLLSISERLNVDPWSIVRDNLLWNQQVHPGMVLRIRELPPQRRYVVHRIRSGDTLSSIAKRYHTTVRAIQRANSMGRSTHIRTGHRLRIQSR